jgi:hypothetical protein
VGLGAPQTWRITGDGVGATARLAFQGSITGASDALTIDFNNSAQLLAADIETGPLTIAGSGVLTSFYGTPTSLNATDGNRVIVSGGASLDVSGAGTVGPLQLSGGAISLLAGGGFSSSPGTLAVQGGLSLDATSIMSMESLADVPDITATGPVDLGDASLALLPGGGCPILAPGETYTLVTTTGSLTGVFAGIPDGAIVAVSSGCPGSTQTMRINYTANSVIATVVNPGPAPTGITVTTNPTTAVTNQPVTLTATVIANYGIPAGTVSFGVNEMPIAGCGSQTVTAHGSSGTATCNTSFTAGDGALNVTYAPSDSATRGSSNTSDTPPLGLIVSGSIAVSPAATTTTVTASSPSVVSGRSVTYTATVTPAYLGPAVPTGPIEFDDNGAPIGSCAKQPLNALRGTATTACTVTYPTTGTHAVTARYAGDGNFNGSASGSTTVTSWSVQALRAQLRPSGKAAAIRALRRHRKLAQRIAAPTAGTLTIRWYGRTIVRKHRHRTLLATGRTTYPGAGTKTVNVALTSAGRAVLKHARRIRITATATFAARGAFPVGMTLSFVLRR